ncbi:MAG: DUF2339 domain-containing protein, partial [Paracoccaceae bacterium]
VGVGTLILPQAVPLVLVALLIFVFKLKARVAQLEGRLGGDTAEAGPAAADQAEEAQAAAAIAVDLPAETAPDADADAGPDLAAQVADVEVPGEAKPAMAAAAAPAGVAAAAPRTSALAEWLKQNWVYAISALSLALAGLFFVQYGIENGLLPPKARVASAMLFGLLLIGGGEWVRRRWGDGADQVTAYLPSTFSGAGLVSIFGAFIAARQLYGLIGPEMAFAGLVATAVAAVVLGWLHGPFLAAVGLIGAAAAPFLVGGQSEAPQWLFGYFTLVTAAGLLIDTLRRWAWVSILSLVLGYGAGFAAFAGTAAGTGWFLLMLAALAFLAICIPARGLAPDHGGPMVSELAFRGRAFLPRFPTGLAAGALLVSSLLLWRIIPDNPAESMLALLCLALLALALTVWSERAPALSDLTLIPAVLFLVRLGTEGMEQQPMARDFANKAIEFRLPETAAPMTMALILGLALAMTLVAAKVSDRAGWLRPFWAAGAALMAPLAALLLELFWSPAPVLGAYGWALHVMALAAVMVALALWFARRDGADMRRAAYATLSALSLIALALFLLATKGALTLALSVLVVVAAALDRRFRLPEMGWFIQAGIMLLSYRLVVDPGLEWATLSASLGEALAAHGGAVVAMVAGYWTLRGMERPGARVFLESAAAGYGALLVNVLIVRLLTDGASDQWLYSHWSFSLNAMPWLVLALVQLYRLKLGGALRWVRWAIAGVAGLIAAAGLAIAVGPANPIFDLSFGGPEGRVHGPLVLDTLLVAYLLPGLTLLLAARWFGHLRAWMRYGLMALGSAFAALYAALEIRRFWRGDDLSVAGVTQPELYSYTLALMIVGAALLYQAIARRSPLLRRLGMAVIALTIAKVFLIDASGLSGLTRVFSFLALGLSLAGLALLNRWAAARLGDGSEGGEAAGKG